MQVQRLAVRIATGRAALLDPALLANKVLRGGLVAFFFQFLLQAGMFFASWRRTRSLVLSLAVPPKKAWP